MILISTDEKELLDLLVKSELEVIEKGFSISELTGKAFLQNAITDFKDVHLAAKYGNIIPSMCMEYRYFIVELLKGIKVEYRGLAVREVIVPTVGSVTTLELLNSIKNSTLTNVE